MRRNEIPQCGLVNNNNLAATESEPPLHLPVLQVLINNLSGKSQEARHFFVRNTQLYFVRGLVPVKLSQTR